MQLHDLFERVVIINLPFKRDRRLRLQANLEQSRIADPAKVVWSNGICGDWAPPPLWWGAGNGAWGCLMSHLRIAQDAIHDQLASVCVLEDDVVFHPRAPEMLERFAKELPLDWDQVYLGGQFLHKHPEQLSPWVVRPYNVNRTHAFALSKDNMPRYLQHIMHAPDYFDVKVAENGKPEFKPNCFHIDHQLGRIHETQAWNIYAPTWWLAGQAEGSSNVSGRINPEMWWHWRARGHQLPFFFVATAEDATERELAARTLHAGNHLQEGTLVDIGIKEKLSDDDLMNWLKMIAGEAVEQWKLPGFQIPAGYPELKDQAARLWSPGVLAFDEALVHAVKDYPFNGFCSTDSICYEV